MSFNVLRLLFGRAPGEVKTPRNFSESVFSFPGSGYPLQVLVATFRSASLATPGFSLYPSRWQTGMTEVAEDDDDRVFR